MVGALSRKKIICQINRESAGSARQLDKELGHTVMTPSPVVAAACAGQADSDSTSSSLAACAAARQTLTPPHRRWLPVLPPGSQIWLPGSLSSRGTRHVRFDRSLLFSQITFGDEMCEDPRASYEAPFILHTLISGPGAAVSNSARTEKRTAQ